MPGPQRPRKASTMDEVNTEQAINTEHTECVPQAAVEILNVTCGFTLEPTDDPGNLTDDGLIIALISLVGDVEWSVFLGLPPGTATAVASAFAGFEIPYESEDMGDAIGELANVVAGQVKTLLDQRSVRVEISLPSVIRAQHLEVLSRRAAIARRWCFQTPSGKLWTGVTVGATFDAAA